MSKTDRKLPSTIHVRYDDNLDDEEYLLASEKGFEGVMEGTDNPQLVGRYVLEKTFSVQRTLTTIELKL